MHFSIGLVQFNPVRRDVSANIRKIRHLLHGVKVDLIVLPELSNSGYLYERPEDLLSFAENRDGEGKFLSSLSEMAGEIGGVIISGFAESSGVNLFNSAAAVSKDGVIAHYRKIHLFDHEKVLFQSGNEGFTVFEWRGVKVGMMICFDWIFPESTRTLAINGAQIVAHPANLVLPYCQEAMITRSIENHIFTITANRIGREKISNIKLIFTGQSQITDPFGNLLFRGPETKPTVHVVDIDAEQANDKAINSYNDLIEDRHPEFYK